MTLRPTHELHQRRFGRNVGVALCLLAFVALVFILTMVKIQRGDDMQGYDHRPQQTTLPAAEPEPAAAPEGEARP